MQIFIFPILAVLMLLLILLLTIVVFFFLLVVDVDNGFVLVCL